MSEGLKLSAADVEDMAVLSAAMEGAITSPGEMSYSSKARHFTVTASRFMWEKYNRQTGEAERIRSGLYFGDVLTVKKVGILQDTPTTALELLDIACAAGEDGVADIHLNFAGGGTLRLAVECINVTLTDAGDSWKADHIPSHEAELTDNNQPS